MKAEIPKDKATRLVNCGMVVLITTGYRDKKNITTCAWHLPLSKNPARVGVALARTHLSSELIRNSREFIVNIPDWSLLDKVVFCGSVSGRQTDKFKKAGFIAQKANVLIYAHKIKECIGSLECSLLDINEIGDHYLFIGEVVYADAEKKYFVDDFWDTHKVKLIFHLGGRFFFKSSSFIEFRR